MQTPLISAKQRRTTLLLLTAWILLLGILSINGFFSNFSALPPRLAFPLLLPLPVILYISYSAGGRELLRRIPLHWLIYLQTFRIVVEIVLWWAVKEGSLPVQMSFEGRNFDLLTGLLALPVGYYCFVKKSWPSWVALLYNIMGLLLLINAVAIAVLSMPTPLRVFHNEPSTTLLAQVPYIYLPGLLVPLAYTLHIFSLRQWFISVKHTRKAILQYQKD